MSKKSRKSSRKTRAVLPLDRPFEPQVLARARDFASRYRLILEPNEDLGFMGTSIEMPMVWGDGRSPDSCVRDTREALVSAIATMLERGETPPAPSQEELRTEQI